jgi:hypothetical protein
MLKQKFLIYLAVWKRPAITEICFMGIARLRRKHNIQAFAVISEESIIPLCEKYGIEWCMHENMPLGKKKNFGLSHLAAKDFDWMIEIGSDDLLKDEYFDLMDWDTEHEVLALRDFVMMNSETGECRHLTDRQGRFGVGRAIRREVLVEMNFTLWGEDQEHGLDNRSTFAMAKHGFVEQRIKSIEPLAIDLKSKENLWPFKREGMAYDRSHALKGLSFDEVNAITNLYAEN